MSTLQKPVKPVKPVVCQKGVLKVVVLTKSGIMGRSLFPKEAWWDPPGPVTARDDHAASTRVGGGVPG